MADRKDKDEAFWRILSAALELDVKKGHLKWTLSDLARKSGITRSLIYYYFGRSKISILKEAVSLIGSEFIGASPERMELWKKGRGAESMKLTRALYEKAPYLSIFFIEHINSQNEIGDSLRQIVAAYKEKLKSLFPKAGVSEVDGLFAIMLGMSFAPRLDDQAIDYIAGLTMRARNS